MQDPILCSVCGEKKRTRQIWFLALENPWEDRIKILRWDSKLAHRTGVHPICGPRHLQELVLHWMTTASLEPFAATSRPQARVSHQFGLLLSIQDEVDLTAASLIAELAVDRESFKRALRDRPESLQVILDELSELLARESSGALAGFESGDHTSPIFPRVI